MPFDIERSGWELLVKRATLQSKPGSRIRTFGSYQVFIDGNPVAGLSGGMCECVGPGDNTRVGKTKHLRIREGRYNLSTQFGQKYRSVGFTDDEEHPMPGFLVLGTEARTAILVHPGHPPNLYLSSIGCFNPTKTLTKTQTMVFAESRARVIAMLDSLKEHDPAAFARSKIGTNTRIRNAKIVIDGEPM